MNRWQDISISDASLKAEFITKFFDGDYIDAFTIISNNPQLNTKAFIADTINQIATILLSLENNIQNEVIDYLSQQYSNFQNIIDNYNLKGNWSASTTYQIYNFVTYNNIDYLYINLTPSSGNLPTNTDYWVEVNIQGEKGAPGLGVNLQYNWSATTPYNALDVVYYNNALWVAKQNNINIQPSDNEYWEEFIKFKLASIYTDYIEPSEDSLYNGLIWFEVFNPQNWSYLTNRNYTWNQVNTNNDTWESVDRGDY